MKTITTIMIVTVLAMTASAETWQQRVNRLENENRRLKTQVAALTKQVIKLQKENHELMGNQEIPVKKVETKSEKDIKKLEDEKKYLKAKLEKDFKYNRSSQKLAKDRIKKRIQIIDIYLRRLKNQKVKGSTKKFPRSS
jgi:type II secretory pathway component PulK